MQDSYFIDYHKLMFHPEKLAQWRKSQHSWKEAKNFYPIYVEVSLSSFCNHRCKFCALDYLGYPGGFADFQNLKKAIKDMARGGVKSILFSGEGEPLLCPKAKEIIKYTKLAGIDVALATNGTFLNKNILENILPYLSWIKVSIDAASAKTHQKIHRPKVDDFDIIINNLKEAVRIRNKNNYQCTLGGQMLLLPDNYKEAEKLAEILKKIGLDYLVIKPYSHNKKSLTQEYRNVNYDKYLGLGKKLGAYNSKKFQVIFRERAMKKTKAHSDYKVCYAVPFFWAHLMTNGDVYGCGNFLGDKRFKLGNYNKKSFKQIWEGEKRQKLWKFMQKGFNLEECRKACRMDEANRYLEKLASPPNHVNFI